LFEIMFLCLYTLVFQSPKDGKTPPNTPLLHAIRIKAFMSRSADFEKNVFFQRSMEVVADAIAAHKQASPTPKHSQTARKTDLKNGIPNFGSRWRAVAAGIKPFAAARPAN